MTAAAPHQPADDQDFQQRTTRGCTIEDRFHPNTGLWSAWVSKGDVRRYCTAPTREELLVAARLLARDVHAAHAGSLLATRREARLAKQERVLQSRYPTVSSAVPNLPVGWRATVTRQPGGQPLWAVEVHGPDGFHVADVRPTHASKVLAATQVRNVVKRRRAELAAQAKKEAHQQRALNRALQTAQSSGRLADAGDLAWDLAIRAAQQQGIPIDTRNAPANTCCASAPAVARDRSWIAAVDDKSGAVLIKSVWWSHRAGVHPKRLRAIVAHLDTRTGEVRAQTVAPNSRTVHGALHPRTR